MKNNYDDLIERMERIENRLGEHEKLNRFIGVIDVRISLRESLVDIITERR